MQHRFFVFEMMVDSAFAEVLELVENILNRGAFIPLLRKQFFAASRIRCRVTSGCALRAICLSFNGGVEYTNIIHTVGRYGMLDASQIGRKVYRKNLCGFLQRNLNLRCRGAGCLSFLRLVHDWASKVNLSE